MNGRQRPAEEYLTQFAQILELPASSQLLIQALTHPSYANEWPEAESNQRFEFLGDAVLGLCVSELLFEQFPQAQEGVLTRMRAQLVNAEALNRIGRGLGVVDVLRMGKGSNGKSLPCGANAVADAVEALLAAVFLHGGWELARRVCRRLFEPELVSLGEPKLDAKSELQERLQALGYGIPYYQVIQSGGPDHARWFEVEVRLGEVRLGSGKGNRKRLAERAAAQVALEHEAWKQEQVEHVVE